MRRRFLVPLFLTPCWLVGTAAAASSLSVEPERLWPPDHRLSDVFVMLHETAGCAAPDALLRGIGSSEADDAPGGSDGRTSGDIRSEEPGSDFHLLLRAERDARGPGRTYTLRYEVFCASGETRMEDLFVVVPHDLGGAIDPLDLTLTQDDGLTSILWNEPGEPAAVDLVRGDVSALALSADGTVILGGLDCLETHRVDDAVPPPGRAFFYLAGYDDGAVFTMGTASAAGPRRFWSGGCRPAAP